MLFSGVWQLCDDGIVRPLIRGEIRAGDSSWRAVEFLLDTGADRTVFSAHVLESLGLLSRTPDERLGGVGGMIESVIIRTEIRFTREEERKVVFRGEYAACTQQEMLDMSVLGRDILDLFAVVVDRPQDVVCLIGGHHTYRIEQA
jgi:predicted aspartyl protease